LKKARDQQGVAPITRFSLYKNKARKNRALFFVRYLYSNSHLAAIDSMSTENLLDSQ
jgi:hypothetical protein